MDVKEILDKVRQQEEKKEERFFALQIGASLVKSAVWVVEETQVKVLAIGDSQAWQENEDLLGAVDATLSSAVEKLSPPEEATEPNKVIFGLLSDWVEEEKIKNEKIKLLREISQKLDLEPVGFVITIEAIVHHLKNIEGVPPTSILIGLGEKELTITLANLGKIIDTQTVKRSRSLSADLAEGFTRFKEKRFPTRILLYNGLLEKGQSAESGGELEEARQELVNYPWQSKQFPFVHLPKVEILSSNFDIKAVALAGGHEVSKAAGIESFVSGVEKRKEVAELDKEPKEKKEEKEREEETKKEIFGFVKDQDIAQLPPVQAKPSFEPEAEVIEKKPRRRWSFRYPQIDFSFFQSFFSAFALKQQVSLVFALTGGLILIIGGALFGLYWYLPRAEIVLSVTPQNLEREFTFTLDPSLKAIDEEALALPGEEITAVIEGSKIKQATGTKLVGDPARGKVTIYNRTASVKTFPAKAELIGPDGLKFSLDNKVTVASESAGPDYAKIPGKATAEVTALVVGTEGNLASGTEFEVADYATSDLIAKNETAFSGGTSREILVISEEDQEKLVVELKEELQKKARDELSSQTPVGKKLLTESLSVNVKEKSFSKEIDEEGDEVELNLKLEAKALTHDEETLRGLIEKKMEDLIPAGFEYRQEESEMIYSLDKINKDGSAAVTVQFTARLIPRFDLEAIKQNLAGKNLLLGKTYLDNLPNVEGVRIKIFPSFPSKLATFPRVARRIEIQLKID